MQRTSPGVLAVCAALLAALAGCVEPPPASPSVTVDADNALRLVGEIVALGPRPSGSEAAAATVAYIVGKGKSYGYQPVVDEWEEETPAGRLTFRNVYATLPGKGKKFVIIGSHYDTKHMPATPDFVGANDSGSSTGLLLEIMRATGAAGEWTGPPLHFAFFDGEECRERYAANDGLHGSRRLAGRLRDKGTVKDCRAMLLLDMVGDAELGITLPGNCDTELIRRARQAAKQQGVADKFGFYLRGAIIDDHVPFQELGIPSLDLIDFQYGPNNSYWHTNLDRMDKLSAASLGVVGNVVLAMLADLR